MRVVLLALTALSHARDLLAFLLTSCNADKQSRRDVDSMTTHAMQQCTIDQMRKYPIIGVLDSLYWNYAQLVSVTHKYRSDSIRSQLYAHCENSFAQVDEWNNPDKQCRQ